MELVLFVRSSLLSSEDASTTRVDVLGSSIFVAISRPEMSTYWDSESEEVCSDELKFSVEVNLLLRLNLSHCFGTQSTDNGIGRLELYLSLEALELL